MPFEPINKNMTFPRDLIGGPNKLTMYISALYFTMTCMTSVGFGNVSPETDNEKMFTIIMMIIGGLYITVIFCLLLLKERDREKKYKSCTKTSKILILTNLQFLHKTNKQN